MIPSLHNGVSALKSLTQGLQVLGNNIANVNSLGYKSSRANYSDNFYMHINDAESGADGEPSNNIQQHGTGVHVGSLSTDFNQGTIEVTGLDLDLAIQGEALPNGGGFFEIVDPVSMPSSVGSRQAFPVASPGLSASALVPEKVDDPVKAAEEARKAMSAQFPSVAMRRPRLIMGLLSGAPARNKARIEQAEKEAAEMAAAQRIARPHWP